MEPKRMYREPGTGPGPGPGAALKQHGDALDYSRNRPAGIGARFAAAFVDGILISVVTRIAVRLLSQAIDLSTLTPGTRLVVVFGAPLLLTLAMVAYPLHRWGKTAGKALLRIRVIRRRGSPELSLGDAIVREFLGKLLSSILFIGYLMALFSDQNLTLHDRLAGTRVVLDDSDG